MCFETPQPALFILHQQTHTRERHITPVSKGHAATLAIKPAGPRDLRVQGRALLCPGSPWAAYLRSRGFSLVRSAGLLSLSQLNHSSLFAVPVIHQTSARGYKRYFSLLTQARMFLSSRCTESPISCKGLLHPASPPGEGKVTIPPHAWSPPRWEHNAAWPGKAGGGGAGLPPVGIDVWDSHLTDNHRKIHMNARML